MTYVLEPEDDRYLSVDVVIDKLRQEFRHVEVDQKQAHKEISNHIEHLKNQQERGVVDYPFDEEIQRLRDVIKESYLVTISNRPDYENDYLSALLEPDTPIVFGFTSYQHEQAGASLAERCAEILDYEIDEK